MSMQIGGAHATPFRRFRMEFFQQLDQLRQVAVTPGFPPLCHLARKGIAQSSQHLIDVRGHHLLLDLFPLFNALNLGTNAPEFLRPTEKVAGQHAMAALLNRRRDVLPVFLFQASHLAPLFFEIHMVGDEFDIPKADDTAAGAGHGVERAVDQDCGVVLLRNLKEGLVSIGACIRHERRACFAQIHRALDHRKVMGRPFQPLGCPLCSGQHAGKRRRVCLCGERGDGVGRNPVPAQTPGQHLSLEILKRSLQPFVKLIAQGGHVRSFDLGRCGQKVFRVVQQADIQRRDAQSIQGLRKLIGEKVGMDAVPDSFTVFHHVLVWFTGFLAGFGLDQILTLDIADFRNEHHLIARDRPTPVNSASTAPTNRSLSPSI